MMAVEGAIMEFEYRPASCEFELQLNLIEYRFNSCDFEVESNSNNGLEMQRLRRELKERGSEPYLVGNFRSGDFMSIFFDQEPTPEAIEYLKSLGGRLQRVILLPSKFSMYHPSDFPVHSLPTDFPVYPLPTNTVYSPTTVLSPVHKK
jgi:hypothetical protein